MALLLRIVPSLSPQLCVEELDKLPRLGASEYNDLTILINFLSLPGTMGVGNEEDDMDPIEDERELVRDWCSGIGDSGDAKELFLMIMDGLRWVVLTKDVKVSAEWWHDKNLMMWCEFYEPYTHTPNQAIFA